MKKLILIFTLFLLSTVTFPQDDELFIAFWNLENLFDTIDNPEKDDAQFLPDGDKEWTDERLDKKMNKLSRVIRSMNNYEGPDILGVCEVEHQYILDSMLTKFLSDKTYKTAYLESPDNRGIDNGLIYNNDIFDVINVDADTVNLSSGRPTRLILQVDLVNNSNDTFYVFVNHWPSRRGGERESEPFRIEAAKTLRTSVDEILERNYEAKIIILGDFNDEPVNVSILDNLKAEPFYCDSLPLNDSYEDISSDLFNLSYPKFAEGEGTYKYRDNWNMLDQIILSRNLIVGDDFYYECNSFEIFKPYFLLTHSGKYKGTAFPTYGGPRYLGGYSDHFPVTAILKCRGDEE